MVKVTKFWASDIQKPKAFEHAAGVPNYAWGLGAIANPPLGAGQSAYWETRSKLTETLVSSTSILALTFTLLYIQI